MRACRRLGLQYWESAANYVLVRVGETAPFIPRRCTEDSCPRSLEDPATPGCCGLPPGCIEHTDGAIEALESVVAARQTR